MDLETYRGLHGQARRLTRSEADAQDLVQDVLLAALRAGRSEPAWLAGVLRRQAAMAVRSAVRRRRREEAAAGRVESAAEPAPVVPEGPAGMRRALLMRLSPAPRRVVVLALHGLSAEEIRWILRISPAAFRQRLHAIRRTLGALPPALRAESRALAGVRDPARSVVLPFGVVRRALKAAMRDTDALGAHDGDGHLLLVRRGAHVSPPGGNG